MIENPPVLTIHRGHRRPDQVLLEAFRGAQTSHLADAMEGRGAVDWRIKPLDPANASFIGPALTAHAYPADFLGVAGAAMEAQAGAVLIRLRAVQAAEKAAAESVKAGATSSASWHEIQRQARIIKP